MFEWLVCTELKENHEEGQSPFGLLDRALKYLQALSKFILEKKTGMLHKATKVSLRFSSSSARRGVGFGNLPILHRHQLLYHQRQGSQVCPE